MKRIAMYGRLSRIRLPSGRPAAAPALGLALAFAASVSASPSHAAGSLDYVDSFGNALIRPGEDLQKHDCSAADDKLPVVAVHRDQDARGAESNGNGAVLGLAG
jgi:hypothetical protein